VEEYSVAELQESCKQILQWLKELKLIEGSVASIDSSKIYTEGKVQEGTAEVYAHIKKENKRGYKIFAIYDPICGILIDFRLFPINLNFRIYRHHALNLCLSALLLAMDDK
jgi:hypothetical protein